MRHRWLHLLGVVALLAALAPAPDRAAASAPSPQRIFGAYVDPWNVDDWARGVGATPQLVAEFEAFSRNRTMDNHLREAERQGVRRLMITWEPWQPVSTSLGPYAQYQPQPGYRNSDIAAGAQDAYILRFARSLATFNGVVYLRYAHEMNGYWYPWSRGPRRYVQAWRHLVGVLRAAGARNARFVWSVNANLFQPRAEWLRKLRRYWPGKRYVDEVGSTTINFGGRRNYPVARFAARLRTLRKVYRKPVFLTETNTAYWGRVRWLRDLRKLELHSRWIKAIVWSQLHSRGKEQMNDAGDVNWDVRHDPKAAAVLRRIAGDLQR